MHVYLAGPITGIPDRNRSVFNKYAAKLRMAGHKVFNPTTLPDNIKNGQALAYEVNYICNEGVQAIAFIPGWENSKGSRVEHALAVALDLKRIYLEEDNEKVIGNSWDHHDDDLPLFSTGC